MDRGLSLKQLPRWSAVLAIVLLAREAHADVVVDLDPETDLSKAKLEERLRIELSDCIARARCAAPESIRIEAASDERIGITLRTRAGDKRIVLSLLDVASEDRERITAIALAELARDDEPPSSPVSTPLPAPVRTSVPETAHATAAVRAPRLTRIGVASGAALHGANDWALEVGLRLERTLDPSRIELQAEMAYEHGRTSTPLGAVSVHIPYVGGAALLGVATGPFTLHVGPFVRVGVLFADGDPTALARASVVQGALVAVGGRFGARMVTKRFAPESFVDVGGVPVGAELRAGSVPAYRIAGLHIAATLGASYAF